MGPTRLRSCGRSPGDRLLMVTTDSLATYNCSLHVVQSHCTGYGGVSLIQSCGGIPFVL